MFERLGTRLRAMEVSSSWCVSTLRRVASDMAPHLDGRVIGSDILDAYYLQVELIYRELVALETLGELDELGICALEQVGGALAAMKSLLEETEGIEHNRYHAPVLHCRLYYLTIEIHRSNIRKTTKLT